MKCDWENEEQLKETYGNIVYVNVDDAYKYSYRLHVTTDKGLYLYVHTGGDANNTYTYEPLSCSWVEHIYAEIKDITVLSAEQVETYSYFMTRHLNSWLSGDKSNAKKWFQKAQEMKDAPDYNKK